MYGSFDTRDEEVRIVNVRNKSPDTDMNTFKNRLVRHWREEDFLYNYEAAVPGHHLYEKMAKRLEQIDLTFEANVCGDQGS